VIFAGRNHWREVLDLNDVCLSRSFAQLRAGCLSAITVEPNAVDGVF
jgi:hypothetical protein